MTLWLMLTKDDARKMEERKKEDRKECDCRNNKATNGRLPCKTRRTKMHKNACISSFSEGIITKEVDNAAPQERKT